MYNLLNPLGVFDDFTPKKNMHNTHTIQNNHCQPSVLWFTGLSGSGKTTISSDVANKLRQIECRVQVLDGDILRTGLCEDLGFSDNDRSENIRRIAQVSKLFIEANYVVLVAAISPFTADRDKARSIIGADNFVEIHCDCSVKECEKRDPKGLYELARLGKIKDFTGIDSPYEAPTKPTITLQTDKHPLADCVAQVMDRLNEYKY